MPAVERDQRQQRSVTMSVQVQSGHPKKRNRLAAFTGLPAPRLPCPALPLLRVARASRLGRAPITGNHQELFTLELLTLYH